MRKNNSDFVRNLDLVIRKITDMKKYSEILFMFVFCVYAYVSAASISKMSLPLSSLFKGILPVLIPVTAVLQLLTHSESKREFTAGSVFMVLLWVLSGISGYESLRYLGMLAAGSIGVDHKKTLRFVCCVSTAVMLITFAYTFAIDPSLNTVYVTSVRIRSTAGFIYPTDIASLVLYTCIMFFVAGEGIAVWFAFAAAFLSFLLSFFYFNSNTSAFCSVVLLVFMLYEVLHERVAAKIPLKWIDRGLSVLALAAVPLLTAAIFVLSMMYGGGNAFAVKLNDLIHDRLRLTSEGVVSMGIRSLGQYIEMVGAAQPGMGKSEELNFLDNSYVQIVVRFGVVAGICILTMWFYIIIRAIRGGNRRIVLVAIIIAIHSFEEHHFTDMGYNSMLFLPLAATLAESIPVPRLQKPSDKVIKTRALCLAAVIVLLLASPLILTATRTAAYKSRSEDLAVSERIEADQEAIQIVMDSHKKPVYADVLSGSYRRAFGGINRSVYSGEDLVRELDCTIITDPAYSVAYFARGCLYCRISDYSAIYTTDRSVADALSDAGYHVAGYYYAETNVALNESYRTDSYSAFGTRGEIKGTITLLENARKKGVVCSLQITSVAGIDAVYNYRAKDFKEDGTLSYDVKFDTTHGDVTFLIKAYNGAKLEVSDAVFSCNSIIDDRTVSFGIREYYADQFTLYRGKYELLTKVKTAGDVAADTTSLGALTISPIGGEADIRDLTITGAAENGEYVFDHEFTSKGANYTFSLKPDKSVNLDSVSASYVVRPAYDYHYTYNKKGQLSRIEYYDLDGNKTYSKEGVFAYEYDYDKNGNRTAIRFFDQSGEPMNGMDGYAEVKKVYDRLNNVVAESYYDTEGNPTLTADGYASYDRDVNVWGSPTAIRYYGTDGKPVITSMGYAEIHLEYDDKGNETIERYYDESGSRCSIAEGYYGCRYEYDDAGNRTLIVYLDDEDKPMNIAEGYAQIHSEYDENGRVTVRYYSDADGNQVTLEDDYDGEYASVTREYDKFGNNIATRYFSEDTSQGYIEIRREYDSKKRVIYKGKFNSDGEGLILKDDYCAYRREFDEEGNISSITYYGVDGEPMLRDGVWSTIRKEYDSEKRVISESYFGLEGEKVLMVSGYHTKVFEYDDAGNMVIEKYYGLDGEPVILKRYRCFEVRKISDADGNIVREEYYGLEGEPVMYRKKYAVRERDFNDSGEVTDTRYYDLEGNLIEIE